MATPLEVTKRKYTVFLLDEPIESDPCQCKGTLYHLAFMAYSNLDEQKVYAVSARCDACKKVFILNDQAKHLAIQMYNDSREKKDWFGIGQDLNAPVFAQK